MIEVHKNLKARYDDMTADYATGDYKELIEKVVIYQLIGEKGLKGSPAMMYFNWVCKCENVEPHRVHGIEDYEKYRDQFEKAEEEEKIENKKSDKYTKLMPMFPNRKHRRKK